MNQKETLHTSKETNLIKGNGSNALKRGSCKRARLLRLGRSAQRLPPRCTGTNAGPIYYIWSVQDCYFKNLNAALGIAAWQWIGVDGTKAQAQSKNKGNIDTTATILLWWQKTEAWIMKALLIFFISCSFLFLLLFPFFLPAFLVYSLHCFILLFLAFLLACLLPSYDPPSFVPSFLPFFRPSSLPSFLLVLWS